MRSSFFLTSNFFFDRIKTMHFALKKRLVSRRDSNSPIRKCTMVDCQCTIVHRQCTIVHCRCTMVHFLMGCYLDLPWYYCSQPMFTIYTLSILYPFATDLCGILTGDFARTAHGCAVIKIY